MTEVSDDEYIINYETSTNPVKAYITGFPEIVFNGLCFTAEEANSTIKLKRKGETGWTGSYSFDKETWTEYVPATTPSDCPTITLANIGDKVYFKGDITADFSNRTYLAFDMTGKIAASGNVNSMYVSENFETLTTLTYKYCYYCLFSGCDCLTSAPELPATVLSEGCYFAMFNACEILETAPVLPATTLAEHCYEEMFSGCENLTTAPALLPATTLAKNCYNLMFGECVMLEKAPELPATTLVKECYSTMFYGCSKLNYIKLAYTGNFNEDYTGGWVDEVAATGDFYYNGTDTTKDAYAIPTGWTVHTF